MKTIELSDALARRIELIAVEAGRQPSEILPFVIRDGIGYTENFIRRIKSGMADADAGNLLDHESVMAEIESLFNHDEKQKAA